MKRNEPFNVLRNPNSWDKCPRAEAIVLTIAGFTSAGAATAALGAFAYNAAILAVSAGLSLVTSWAVAALTPAPPTPKQSLLVNTRDAAAPQEQVYGEVRKGGVTTYYESTRGGSVLYQIIVLAAHEIESVEDIYVNDKVVTLSEDGYDSGARTGAGWVLDEEFTDDGNEHELRIFYHKGDQTSITDTFDNSSVESLDSVFFDTGSADEDSQNFGGAGQPTKESFVGNGMAYLFVRFSFNASVFQQGIPLITARIKGKKIYDPRETGHSATDPSTWEYSDNAALCIRDFLSQPAGLNDSEIDDAVIQVAANTSDELVPLAGGGSEPRYTINGVVRSNQSYGDVLQEMTTACAGTLFWGGGKWKLTVGEYNAPTKTLTLDDLRSGISLSTRNNLRDQFNRVQGVFTDASNGFIPADYPPIVSEGPGSFTEQDGGVPQALDLDLPFTTSSSAAQRLAKMTLFRGREQMVFSADFGLNAFDIEVGEIISLDMDRYGWTGKDFEVIGWNFNINGEAGDLRISMVLRETSESAFDWDAEEEDIIGNDTTLTRTLDPVGGLTASFDGSVAKDGTFLNGIKVDWNVVPGSTGYQVEWTVNDSIDYSANGGVVEESDAVTTREQFIYKAYIEILYRQPDQDGFDFYNTGGGSGLTEEEVRENLFASPERDSVKFAGLTVSNPSTEYIIKPVLDNTLYNIRVRAVNAASLNSPWRSVTFDTAQDNTTPNAPTGVSAIGYFQSSVVSWTPPTTNTDGSPFADLSKFNVYRSLSNSFSTSSLAGSSQTPSFKDGGLEDNTTYYYWITTEDYSGNESVESSSASSTTNFISAADMVDDIREEIGAARIDVVSSLPSGAGFEVGDFVYLTTDGKLYEWNGSSWIPVVGEIPFESITETEISDDAISTPKLQANSIVSSKILAGEIKTVNIDANAITAGKIETGAVSADKIAVNDLAAINANLGTVTAGSISTLSGGVGIQVNVSTKPNAVYISQNSNPIYGLFVENLYDPIISEGAGGAALFTSLGGFTVEINNTENNSSTDDAAVFAQNSGGSSGSGGAVWLGESGLDGGYGVNVLRGGYYDTSGDGYLPFTGSHEAMILKTEVLSQGDIVCDHAVIAKSISDSFTEVVKSAQPNTPSAVGVYKGTRSSGWEGIAAFVDKETTSENSLVPATNSDREKVHRDRIKAYNLDWTVYEDDYTPIFINSVGEGAVNVCGEGGDISKGDLIVTSSTPGKGMRQSDDIVRSYTVAKSREDVTFSDPTEVKMVACIYLCG